MKPYLAYIEWNDAIYNANWFTTDLAIEWGKRSEFLIKEVGWVVEENKDFIVLGCGRKEEDEFTSEQWIGLHKIPKGWVKIKKRLK